MNTIAIKVGALGLLLSCVACSSLTSGSGSGLSGLKPAGGSGSTGGSVNHSTTGGGGASTPTGSGGGGASGWCAQLQSYGSSVLGSGDGDLTPAVLKKAEQLAATAPSEIRGDVLVIVKADEKIAKGDVSAADTPGLEKSGAHVVTWIQSHCPGVLQSLNPGLPNPPSSP